MHHIITFLFALQTLTVRMKIRSAGNFLHQYSVFILFFLIIEIDVITAKSFTELSESYMLHYLWRGMIRWWHFDRYETRAFISLQM